MQHYFGCVIARGIDEPAISLIRKKKFYIITKPLFNVIAARDNIVPIIHVASRQQNWVLLTHKAGKNDQALYIQNVEHYVHYEQIILKSSKKEL